MGKVPLGLGLDIIMIVTWINLWITLQEERYTSLLVPLFWPHYSIDMERVSKWWIDFVWISDTPKNSTSDYKTSPGSSPSKKTSGSLLYKEGVGMGTLRGPAVDSRQRSKSDDDDLLYKVRGYCTWKRVVFSALLICFLLSLIFNFLYGTEFRHSIK